MFINSKNKRGVVINKAYISDARIEDSFLENVSLVGAIAYDISFEKSILIDVTIQRGLFSNSNFKDTILINFDARRADLTNANFDGALIGVNVRSESTIDLRGTDLTNATFNDATIKGRIRFSRDTKIKIDQLLQAREAHDAIEEYEKVFEHKEPTYDIDTELLCPTPAFSMI